MKSLENDKKYKMLSPCIKLKEIQNYNFDYNLLERDLKDACLTLPIHSVLATQYSHHVGGYEGGG